MDVTVGEKMKALADEVRELSGTTVKMGIENMTIEINSANDTIAEQANLLAQVITALDGKAAGSGNSGENLDTVLAEQQTLLNNLGAVLDNKASGGGNSAIETCTVILDTSTLGNDPIYCVSASVLNNGSVTCYYLEGDSTTVTIQNVVCGSTIAFISHVYNSNGGNNLYTEIEGSATIQDVYDTVNTYNTLLIIVQAPSIAGETSTIRVAGDA